MNTTEFFDSLIQLGWKVSLKQTPSFNLPAAIKNRYPSIPIEVTDFLSRIKLCANQQETVWFMSESDYSRNKNDSLFRWNDCEGISLSAAAENDQWRSEVESFWDKHFPILLSVFLDYAYIAVNVSEENFGAIVVGEGPEFEESAEIAYSNLEEFFTAFIEKLNGQNDTYKLWMIRDPIQPSRQKW
jgi:hypothetical protein